MPAAGTASPSPTPATTLSAPASPVGPSRNPAKPTPNDDVVNYWGISQVAPFELWISASQRTDAFLLHTEDGRSWDRRPLPPTDVANATLRFVDRSHGWFVGDDRPPSGGCAAPGATCRSVIYGTTDGGRSWTPQWSWPWSAVGASLRAFYALDARHAWVAEYGQGCTVATCSVRVRSTTDGTTWNAIGELPSFVTNMVFVSATLGWAASYTNMSGPKNVAEILVTTNGGASWTRQFHADGGLPRFAVSFANAREGWALGSDLERCGMSGCDASAYSVYATSDGGATWETRAQPLVPTDVSPDRQVSGGGFFDRIVFSSRSADWSGWITVGAGAGSGHGGVVASSDGGRSWIRSGGDAQGSWDVREVSSPNDPAVAWAVGNYLGYDGGFLAETGDGGRTWTRVLPSPLH